MRKNCSDVYKLCPCLVTESTNWARMRTIVTAALQRQYSQTELIFWVTLVPSCPQRPIKFFFFCWLNGFVYLVFLMGLQWEAISSCLSLVPCTLLYGHISVCLKP